MYIFPKLLFDQINNEIPSIYENRVMYGEEFHAYQELVTDVFHEKLDELIEVHKAFCPFPDGVQPLKKFKNEGWQLILMSNTNHDIRRSNRQQFEMSYWLMMYIVTSRICISFRQQVINMALLKIIMSILRMIIGEILFPVLKLTGRRFSAIERG